MTTELAPVSGGYPGMAGDQRLGGWSRMPARPVSRAVGLVRNFTSDVYWWEPDGRVLRLSPGDGIYSMACIHPAAENAVFWGGATGRPRLWVADASGGLDAITQAKISARHPSYDLHGRMLVYCSSRDSTETIESLRSGSTTTMPADDARMSIMLRASDGSWERQLTDGRHLDQRPALSPDGSRVAFISDRSSPRGLWLVATDGRSEPEPLLENTPCYRPCWSVDGSSIYFVAFRPHRHQIHRIAVTGGQPVPLHNDDRGFSHGPYADPAGDRLIVHSTRGAGDSDEPATWRLYELPLDGSPPWSLWPPGYMRGAHGTRARNGVITFDVSFRRV
jgi:hypothetical protein